MKADPAGWNIVLRGAWNRAIFSPPWVGKELFGVDEVEILVPFLQQAPTIFKHDLFDLQVSDERIVLVANTPDTSSIEAAEKMACKVLDTLPHTPITAVGVNFRFEDTSPSEQVTKLFENADNADLSLANWDISSRKIVRSLASEETVLNLSLILEAATLVLDANFHFAVSGTTAAVTALSEKTSALHRRLLELLLSVYNLSMEDLDRD